MAKQWNVKEDDWKRPCWEEELLLDLELVIIVLWLDDLDALASWWLQLVQSWRFLKHLCKYFILTTNQKGPSNQPLMLPTKIWYIRPQLWSDQWDQECVYSHFAANNLRNPTGDKCQLGCKDIWIHNRAVGNVGKKKKIKVGFTFHQTRRCRRKQLVQRGFEKLNVPRCLDLSDVQPVGERRTTVSHWCFWSQLLWFIQLILR